MDAEKKMHPTESHSENAVLPATTFQMFVDLKKSMTSLENQLAVLHIFLPYGK